MSSPTSPNRNLKRQTFRSWSPASPYQSSKHRTLRSLSPTSPNRKRLRSKSKSPVEIHLYPIPKQSKPTDLLNQPTLLEPQQEETQKKVSKNFPEPRPVCHLYPSDQPSEPRFIPTDNNAASTGSSEPSSGMPQELAICQNDNSSSRGYPSEPIRSLFFKGDGATYSTRELELSSAGTHSGEPNYQGPSEEPEPLLKTNQPDSPSRGIIIESYSVVQSSMTKIQSCTVDEYSTRKCLPEPVPSSVDPSVEYTASRVTRASGYPDGQIDFPSKAYPAPPLLATGSYVTRRIPPDLSSAPDLAMARGLTDQNPDPSTGSVVVPIRKKPSELFSIQKSIGDTTGIRFQSVSKPLLRDTNSQQEHSSDLYHNTSTDLASRGLPIPLRSEPKKSDNTDVAYSRGIPSEFGGVTGKKEFRATGFETWSETDLQLDTSGPTVTENEETRKRFLNPSNPTWKRIPSELMSRDSRESSSRDYPGSTIVNESALLESADNSSMTRYSGDLNTEPVGI